VGLLRQQMAHCGQGARLMEEQALLGVGNEPSTNKYLLGMV